MGKVLLPVDPGDKNGPQNTHHNMMADGVLENLLFTLGNNIKPRMNMRERLICYGHETKRSAAPNHPNELWPRLHVSWYTYTTQYSCR